MDNYPTYYLLNRYNMIPFIAMYFRTKLKFNYPHPDILCLTTKENLYVLVVSLIKTIRLLYPLLGYPGITFMSFPKFISFFPYITHQ